MSETTTETTMTPPPEKKKIDKRTTSALLYLDGISVSFDGFKALNELSFIIEPGEMRAIIGPNGAGKTTMMDCITGKTRPDSGDVFYQAGTIDLSLLDETEIASLGIGRKFQKPTVFEMHTVEDNLLLALKNDRSVRAALFWQSSGDQEKRIDQVLDTVRLKGVRSRIAGGLSHGQKPISAGSISLDGTDITKLPTVDRARGGIAIVPQGREIFPLLTVEENLETGFAPLKRDQRTVPDDVFTLFPVLRSMLGRRGGDLSGGQQQQLAIGRALVMRPKLLLLDEPTEGIQPSIIKDIGRAIDYLRSLKEMAIILVEQYLDFAQELGDQLIVMDRGSIVYQSDKANMDEAAIKRALAI